MTEISRGEKGSNTLGANCLLATYNVGATGAQQCPHPYFRSFLCFSMLFCMFFSFWILSQGLALQLRAAYSARTLPASTSEGLGLQSWVCRHTPPACCDCALSHTKPAVCSSGLGLTGGWAANAGGGTGCRSRIVIFNCRNQPHLSTILFQLASAPVAGRATLNTASMLLLSFPKML